VNSILSPNLGPRTPGLINASLLGLSVAVMTNASRRLSTVDLNSDIPSLLRGGAVFQGTILTFAGLIVVVNRRFDQSSTASLWRRPARARRQLRLSMLGVLGVGIVTLVGYLAVARHPAGSMRAYLSPWDLLIPVFAASNAASEEVMTRFTVMHLGVRSRTVKIALSATIFGFMHLSAGTPSGPIGFILTFLLGALLMACAVATDTLRYSFLVHFGLDLVVFAALWMSVTEGIARGT
jgi:membrane protease YdiL (CAAX protease family)